MNTEPRTAAKLRIGDAIRLMKFEEGSLDAISEEVVIVLRISSCVHCLDLAPGVLVADDSIGHGKRWLSVFDPSIQIRICEN
jgi:hypothetical protein